MKFSRTYFSYFFPCFLLIAIAGIIVYRNACGAPFIFDDITQIVQNPKIQSLAWPWQFLENNRRPFLYTSLAFDFHQYGLNPFGFHIFNIIVHLLAAMVLFLLVNKTCRYRKFSPEVRRDASLLALGASLIWLCHPIQTQAVTYIIQRAESLMGLFFLMAVFFSAQYLTSRRVAWLAAAGLAAVLSGLTKEVALALPFVVLLYDRAFTSRSFRDALRENGRLYCVLSLTWAVMLYLYFTTQPEDKLTAGFGMNGMTPWVYAINQPKVILHYLKLCVFPSDLVFYYDMPPVSDLGILLPSLLVVLSLLLIAVVVFRFYPVMSFLILSFFAILAPSSSFIPVKDLIFEYRVYLSLSCLAVLVVFLVHFLILRFCHESKQKVAFSIVIGTIVLILGGLTSQRNQIYLSEERLWQDVIHQQPWNSRAYNNFGEVQLRQGHEREAKESFLKSIDLNGSYAAVYANVAVILLGEGKLEDAMQYAKQAIAVEPDFAAGYHNLGIILSRMGRYQEAIPCFEKTLQLGFIHPTVLKNLGIALAHSGRTKEAAKVLMDALRMEPDSREIRAILKELK